MREMERLISTLFPKEGPTLVDLKFFPGEQPVTVEEFCEEASSAFLLVDTQRTEATTSYHEDLRGISVDRFLAEA